MALRVNVDYADVGFLTANSGLKFGALSTCGLSSDTDLNGQSIRQFLGVATTALAGGSHNDSLTDLDSISIQVNAAFDSGAPSTWAQQHLRNGACH